VTDAHLAALAIEHGPQLFSADAGLSRFPGLRWVDPLRRSWVDPRCRRCVAG